MNFGYLFLLLLQRLLLLLLLVPGWENTILHPPNVTSETNRKWWFWLLFPLLLLWILAGSCCWHFCSCWSPDGKTPWQWRTEKPQNCTPKMPNVTSETHRKLWFWLLFPLAAAMNWRAEKPQNWLPFPPAAADALAAAAGPRMGKHHGSEGRKSPKLYPDGKKWGTEKPLA